MGSTSSTSTSSTSTSSTSTSTLTNENIKTAITFCINQRDWTHPVHGHISAWDTSKVTDMQGIFSGGFSYDEPDEWDLRNFNEDISGWDVSNVTNMTRMFENAQKFKCDLSEWNVSNVTEMDKIFHNAYEQYHIDQFNWKIPFPPIYPNFQYIEDQISDDDLIRLQLYNKYSIQNRIPPDVQMHIFKYIVEKPENLQDVGFPAINVTFNENCLYSNDINGIYIKQTWRTCNGYPIYRKRMPLQWTIITYAQRDMNDMNNDDYNYMSMYLYVKSINDETVTWAFSTCSPETCSYHGNNEREEYDYYVSNSYLGPYYEYENKISTASKEFNINQHDGTVTIIMNTLMKRDEYDAFKLLKPRKVYDACIAHNDSDDSTSRGSYKRQRNQYCEGTSCKEPRISGGLDLNTYLGMIKF